MLKGSDVIGTTVITRDTGTKLADVKDIIFSSSKKQVLALLIEESGILSDARVVPFSKIKAMGNDGIIISNSDDVIKGSEDSEIDGILDKENIAKDATGNFVPVNDTSTFVEIDIVYYSKICTTFGHDLRTFGNIFLV